LGGHFLITTDVDVDQTLCTIPNQTETQQNIKLPPKTPIYVGKICDMRTLLKYAKNAAIA